MTLDELVDLGASAEEGHAAVRAELHEALFCWLRRRKHRTTVNEAELGQRYGVRFEDKMGIAIGWWEDEEGRNF